MFLNLIVPLVSIFLWLYYAFTNDLDEILLYPPILLLIPYFFLVSKSRKIRVMKKLSPFETPITQGYIKQGYKQTFALLAEYDKGSYKLYFNGNKKSQKIVSVQKNLSFNTKQTKDPFECIQLQLEEELILYAPHKGATVWGQSEYAQNILDDMIANGVKTH